MRQWNLHPRQKEALRQEHGTRLQGSRAVSARCLQQLAFTLRRFRWDMHQKGVLPKGKTYMPQCRSGHARQNACPTRRTSQPDPGARGTHPSLTVPHTCSLYRSRRAPHMLLLCRYWFIYCVWPCVSYYFLKFHADLFYMGIPIEV